MDKEKINKAAEEYARECWDAGNHHRIAAFKDGAQWLMQQPLCERLTDVEKEKIKAMYAEACLFAEDKAACKVEPLSQYYGRKLCFEMVFGKDFLIPKIENNG